MSASSLSTKPSVLRAVMHNPHMLNRLFPGVDHLAQRIADTVKHYYPDSDLGIVELGAGDGRITEALLMSGIPQQQLLLLEADAAWSTRLQKRFPDVRIANSDPLQLKRQLCRHDKKTSVIVSNLSLGSLSLRKERALMQQIDESLSEDGIFIQLTYKLYNPIFIERSQQFTRIASSIVWQHLPPARIDVFRHRSVEI